MNIWAVGRNYALHAKELGSEIPKEPFFFLKSGNCLLPNSDTIWRPDWAKNFHHELELALLLGENKQITHIALALDLTERDLQTQAKNEGQPWTLAKSFKFSCPITPWIQASEATNYENLQFTLEVNGQIRQSGSPSEMVFKIPELIKYLNRYFPLSPGDIVLTGTPHGVGPLQEGDHVAAHLKGILSHSWLVKTLKST